jgi:hypothetical protein
VLAAAAAAEPDHILRLKQARILVESNDRRGLEIALGFLDPEVPLLFRDEAHQLLRDHSGQDFGYDPTASSELNTDALTSWRAWLNR